MKILVIHPFGIGDVLFGLPAVEALKSRGHKLDWIANERTADLAQIYCGYGRVWVFDRDGLRARRAESWAGYARAVMEFWKPIRAARYDACLDWSLGREFSFMALGAGIRTRVGWDFKRRGLFLNRKKPFPGFDDVSARQVFWDAAKELDSAIGPKAGGYPQLQISDEVNGGVLNRFPELAGSPRGVAVIAPGGGASWGEWARYKQWPPERFGRLGRWLEGRGHRVAVIGDAADRGALSACAAQLDRPIRIEEVSLPLAAGALAQAVLFVGNDGGLLHLANALRVPCVGIYGPVSEAGYGPYRSECGEFRARTVTSAAACRPCYRNFKFPPCPNDKICLTQIPESQVQSAILDLL